MTRWLYPIALCLVSCTDAQCNRIQDAGPKLVQCAAVKGWELLTDRVAAALRGDDYDAKLALIGAAPGALECAVAFVTRSLSAMAANEPPTIAASPSSNRSAAARGQRWLWARKVEVRL